MEKQEQYLEENNIILDHIKIKNNKTSAIYLNIEGQNFIGIDDSKINTRTERFCVIQHEIAHYQLGAVYTLYSSNTIQRSRIEYRADKKEVNEIIPLNKLKEFIIKNRPKYACEIAEEFGVTEELVKKALQIYTIIN